MLTVKRIAAAAALLAASLAAPDASADGCVRTKLDVNSADFALAATSAGRYMQLTSAASYAERRLLKGLFEAGSESDGGKGVVGMRFDWLFGVGRAPVAQSGNGCAPYGLAPFDMYSGNVGIAMGYGPVHAFYATSGAAAAAQNTLGRSLGAMYVPPISNVYSVIAPVVGSSSGTTHGVIYSFDYIAGAGLDTKWVTASGGYIGSKGIYTSFTQPKLKLFAAAAIRTVVAEVPYLRTGIDHLKWFEKNAMASSAYFRQLRMAPPERLIGGAFEEGLGARGFDFRTAHVEQTSIYRIVDVAGAYGLPPFNGLHLLDLGVHTPAPADGKEDGGTVGARVGIVRVPAQRMLEQSGKPLVHVSIDAVLARGQARLSLALNDPEILSMYPMSANSVNLTAEFLFDPSRR